MLLEQLFILDVQFLELDNMLHYDIIKDLAYKYEVDEQQTIHIIQQVDYIRTVNPQFNKPVLTMVLEAGFDFGEIGNRIIYEYYDKNNDIIESGL